MGVPIADRSQATKTATEMKVNKKVELALELGEQGYSLIEVQPSRRV